MDIKTVDEPSVLVTDELYKRQKENVSKMRTALLSFTDENGVSVRRAIQGITGMRIYHQIIRIIRYTELMDKLTMLNLVIMTRLQFFWQHRRGCRSL